jgi:UDP-N-acetylglucosamine--N-acetylmuramyl-(pentapeptide) pyrophosphoryl-undecaprenol N-acetylglucosamine transferase
VLHEQNSVAGMANKVLAGVADRVFTAFPNVFQKGPVGGQPAARCSFEPAKQRRSLALPGRTGPLRLLVVGGSLGAQGAQRGRAPGPGVDCAKEQRPRVLHQSGATQIDALRANYQAAGVQAELHALHRQTRPSAFAAADMVDLPRRRQHRD